MVVAATGDDKVNLVVSLLAKTEFAVPRVVARVNRAENEWLFTEQWGVDVAVSKPRLMAALVEEAVTVGDLVRLMTFRQGEANLVEITLPPTAPYVGQPVRAVPLPRDSALVAILRGKRVLVPSPDDPLEAGDELVFVCTAAGGGRRARGDARRGQRGTDPGRDLSRRRRQVASSGVRSRAGGGCAAQPPGSGWRADSRVTRRTVQTVISSSSAYGG